MWQMVTAVPLLVVCCAACAASEQATNGPRQLAAREAFDEGTRLKRSGQYAEAVTLFERALRLWETVPGEAESEVADCLALLGELHTLLGDYAHAEPLLVRSLQIREAALGQQHPNVAHSLNNLAFLYATQGLYTRAEPLYERALRIWETALGQQHPDVATCLSNLSVLYQAQGLHARAVPLAERALMIREAVFGGEHPDVANSLNNLAFLYGAQGQYARAEPLHERALAIREAVFGGEHPDVGNSLNNLAFLYSEQGQYARAEPLHERALRILETTLGENHPHVAFPLNNLADIYRAQGLYARAEPLFERALKVREAALGKHHPDVTSSLNNLAALYDIQGQYARAEPLYERALKVREATLGPDHPLVAVSFNNLAVLYASQGEYKRAQASHERALEIQEAALGADHPFVATSLNNLAVLHASQGQYARAEPLYERALKIREATLGESHPDFADSLTKLALLRLAQGSVDAALPLLERALTSTEQHLRREALGLSEKRLASLLRVQRANAEVIYAAARAHPGEPRVLALALSSVLLRKDRSAQEAASTSHLIYRSLQPQDRDTFEKLRALRTQLSTLALAGPGTRAPHEHQQRLKELTAEGDALEALLARRSEPLRRLLSLPPPSQLLSHVKAALPSDGALVEFVAYQEHLLFPRPGLVPDERKSPLRYLALVLFPDGRLRAVDLGLAEPIDQAVLRLQHVLAGRAASYLPAAQDLFRQAFHPLIASLGKSHRLFLALDGQLLLVPFAALHDGRRFLVDAFDITYLTSGRDLLPRSENLPAARSVVVLADPDFGPALSTSEPLLSRERSQGPDIPWAPLPGTRLEARAIHRLFPQAQVLLGAEASKQALLEVSTPGVLHIATHGFFLNDSPRAPGTRTPGFFGAVATSLKTHPEDPLLRSGLVLADAHAPGASPGSLRLEDSLVTALELTGLNLWGTQLVVLSACDTGRGDVKRGEGVYGLRRALLVAGAETVVTSLWKVDDKATRQLMEDYYHHLLAGQGRSQALRAAMRALRRQEPHPHIWAAFTALGMDAPLRLQ